MENVWNDNTSDMNHRMSFGLHYPALTAQEASAVLAHRRIPHTVGEPSGDPNSWTITEHPDGGIVVTGPTRTPFTASNDAETIATAFRSDHRGTPVSVTATATPRPGVGLSEVTTEYMNDTYGPVGAVIRNSYWSQNYTILAHDLEHGTVTVLNHDQDLEPDPNQDPHLRDYHTRTHQTPRALKDLILRLPAPLAR